MADGGIAQPGRLQSGDAELADVVVREVSPGVDLVPASLAHQLNGAVFGSAAGRSAREILEALLWEHIDHMDPERMRALRQLLETSRNAPPVTPEQPRA